MTTVRDPLEVWCPYCGAPPREPCRTRRTRGPHTDRILVARGDRVEMRPVAEGLRKALLLGRTDAVKVFVVERVGYETGLEGVALSLGAAVRLVKTRLYGGRRVVWDELRGADPWTLNGHFEYHDATFEIRSKDLFDG